MLAGALQYYQRAWWVLAFPGFAILLTVLAFNLFGDGLRDALDPKLNRGCRCWKSVTWRWNSPPPAAGSAPWTGWT